MTDRFASHVLRALLLVLSGLPPPELSRANTILGKSRKGKNLDYESSTTLTRGEQQRPVPDSFNFASRKIISDIIVGLNTNSLRALAIHPNGNPVLQLLIEIESLTTTKPAATEKSLIQILVPDDPPLEGTASAVFINGLFYDSVGSRLLESIVAFAPGKTFKGIYKNMIRDRIGSLACHESASYVISKVLERLGKDDLELAMISITPQITNLLARSRTAIIKTLVERSMVRGLNLEPVALAFETELAASRSNLLRVLHLDDDSTSKETGIGQNFTRRDAQQVHGSLLAQTLLSVPGRLSAIVFASISALSLDSFLRLACNPISSRVLQSSMVLPTSAAAYRRKTINRLYGHLGRLAINPSGSHLLDSFWMATAGLGNYGERIAEELLVNETAIRESRFGRAVWRNWSMDTYKRRKGEWIATRRLLDAIESSTIVHSEKKKGISGIELARARYHSAKMQGRRV